MNLKQLVEGTSVYGKVQIIIDCGESVEAVNIKDVRSYPLGVEDIPAIGSYTRYEVQHMQITNITSEASVDMIPAIEPETARVIPFIAVSLDSRVLEEV